MRVTAAELRFLPLFSHSPPAQAPRDGLQLRNRID
jgi:hypothetical protein